jgi:NAD(P)-dependent dehydrogenase (short-subunit alcohol dehydrogenase family)
VSGDLTGAVVVVVGGSGGVGEGVVRALVAAGATVIATGRDERRLAALRERIAGPGRLVTEVLDTDVELDARVRALAERHGPFDGVVFSVASWGDQGRKPALAITDDEWDHLIDANLTSGFRLLRAFVPVTKRTGMIARLDGMSAELPFPGAAVVALSGAATKSLMRTVAAELGGRGPRIYEVILGVVRTRARQEAGVDDLRWLDGEEIGAHLGTLLDGSSPLSGTTVQYFVDKAAGPQADSGRF